MKKQVCIDGQWLYMKNWFAIKKSQDIDKGVISFLMSIIKYIKIDQYESQFRVLWDYGKSRYRDHIKTYKANRVRDDSFNACWSGMDKVRKILPTIGINCIRYYGVEADDFSYLYSKMDYNTLLISRDNDWYGSINKNTCVFNSSEKVFMDLPLLLLRYKINSEDDFCLYKSIYGDKSDNICGLTKSRKKVLEILENYKNDNCSEKDKEVIDSNISLIRLDKIIDDKLVVNSVIEQEAKINFPKHLGLALAPNLNDYPAYFSTELTKYMKNKI